jgi:hypothetical protein
VASSWQPGLACIAAWEAPSARIPTRAEDHELARSHFECIEHVRIDRLGSQHVVVDEPKRRHANGASIHARGGSEARRHGRKPRHPRGQEVGGDGIEGFVVDAETPSERNEKRRAAWSISTHLSSKSTRETRHHPLPALAR